MTNTRNSVRLMSKLIINDDVKGLQAKAWLTSLAFIPQPNSEMILDVKVVLLFYLNIYKHEKYYSVNKACNAN